MVGTDLFHASIVPWAAAVAHVFTGDIDYGLAGTLLVGAIPGIVLSTQISLRAPQGALRAALGVILVGAALGMLSKAGVGIPSAVLAVAPVVVIAIVAGAVVRESPAVRSRTALVKSRAWVGADHRPGRRWRYGVLGVEQLGALARPAAHRIPPDTRVRWYRLCHVAEKCPSAS